MTDSPITFHADPEHGVVWICVRGMIAPADVRRVLREVTAAHPGRPRLWDVREVLPSQWSTEELRSLATHAAATDPQAKAARVAVLVCRDFDFGMARMYEQIGATHSPIQHAVFRDEAEALAWITTKRA